MAFYILGIKGLEYFNELIAFYYVRQVTNTEVWLLQISFMARFETFTSLSINEKQIHGQFLQIYTLTEYNLFSQSLLEFLFLF